MEPFDIFGIAMVVLIALAVVSRGLGLDEGYVERWATSSSFELTDETRRAAERRLLRSRRSRTVGALIGFLAPLIYGEISAEVPGWGVTSGWDPGQWSAVLMFVGYLMGAAFAELVMDRPRPRAMPPVPGSRRLGDYLSGQVLLAQRGLAILAAFLVIAYLIVEPHSSVTGPSAGAAALFGLGAMCFATVLEGLQRSVIGRRRWVVSSGELALDDAVRSFSTRLVAAGGIPLLTFFVAGPVAALLVVAGAGSLVVFPIGLGMFIAGIGAWLHLSKPQGFHDRGSKPYAVVS
jgi:hypothetical protein